MFPLRGSARLCQFIVAGVCLVPLVAVAQPGRGPDAQFPADRQVFQWLLRHHEQIRREVKDIPGGVETRTESDDPEVAAKIQEHVQAMARRVEAGRGIRYRDPLFAALFQQGSHITIEHEATKNGVLVREIGDTPQATQLIRAHAKVVSAFVARGFAEMHVNHPLPTAASSEKAAQAESPQAVTERRSSQAVFVDFDRLYIPALALTNQGTLPASRQAVQRLAAAWPSMNAEITTALGDEGSGRLLSDVVGESLRTAERHLERGACPLAHESLEPIREILAAARRSAAIEYPLDYLTDFHATMEQIVKPAMDLSPDKVDDVYRDALRGSVAQAVLQWKRVEATDFASLWPAGAVSRGAQVREVRRALERLQVALSDDDTDPAALLKAARGLKPPFAKLYMSFGRFPQSGD